MNPRFSVVTVARNDAPGLRTTWESLREQRCGDWEWVVVDGASTDGSPKWLATLTDARVRWSSEADAGAYDAMNRGIAGADGQLVVFLNAGDAFAGVGVLDVVHADQARRGWRWGYGATQVVTADGEVAGLHQLVPFRRRWLEWGYRSVPHPSTYFTRDLLEELGGYDLDFPVAADQELILRAALLAEPGVMTETLARFALGGVSSTQQPDAFVHQTRQIRAKLGRPIGGHAALDTSVTAVLAVEERLRARVSRSAWRKVDPS